MKSDHQITGLVNSLSVLFFGLLLIACTESSKSEFNREKDFNFGWKFQLMNDTLPPDNVPMIDENWRDIRLPHDWSIEASFDSTLEGCTGYLPGGIGIYQKHFPSPEQSKDKNTYILFDGVYNNATFWLNGIRLGENPYGYSPVYFDLTETLKTDGSENVLTVHVDRTRYADSRWYTGSGIYRNVKLVTVDKLHIPIWGTFVTTPEISNESAKVTIEIKVENLDREAADFQLTTRIEDAQGNLVSETSDDLGLASQSNKSYYQSLSVINPQLWDTDNPYLYRAITSVNVEGVLVDEYITVFGIRSLRFDEDQGFFLNGKSTYAKGVCLHHDAGLVGAAVPKGVWKRRLQKLKDAGVNAIRTSHNPFSEEFLDLCDEMGFLVQNEIFDEMDNPKDKRFNLNEREVLYHTRGYTEHFQKWGKSDLRRTILRDRNHPSVFQWSIGNEIEWTYPDYKHVSGLWDDNKGYWNKIPTLTPAEMKSRYDALPDRKYKLAETAKRLSGWVKELDSTRPVTANLIIPVASLATGYADALDVVGFSYQIAQYDWSKKHYPQMLFTGNENSGLLSEWNSILEKPYVFSMFMWTGIDYMGESNLSWPKKGWSGDMLDFAGFEKPGWYNFKAIWKNSPHISIGTRAIAGSKFQVNKWNGKPEPMSKKALNWENDASNTHWNYTQDELILVEVRSNLPVVELFLDGTSLGSRSMSECPDRIFRWAVPFHAGTLTAKGGFDGNEISDELSTTSDVVSLDVTSDKELLIADGYDVAHIVVQLVDKEGLPVKTSDQKIEFEIKGNIKLLGVDNGSETNVQNYQSNNLLTEEGRCLAIVQSIRQSGEATVTVKSVGLEPQIVSLKIQ
ncbi:MAG: DUF4982 domain-containing protein [Cyclobacteriaceae bacterium]